MNAKIKICFAVIIGLMMSGCGEKQVLEPTLIPLLTTTPSITHTPVPISVSTPIAISSTYNPVPRWMILEQPGYAVEIFGEDWNYTNDRWGETYACISYTREKEPFLLFEECFALITQPNLTLENQRDAFLNDGHTILEPNNTFGDVGQISLMAKRLEENSTKFIKFFELIEIDEYILLVEMNVVTDDTSSLQSIYESQAASIINYALQNMLEKSHYIPRPTATPMSLTQESIYATLVDNLITEAEASILYEGTWENIGDFVYTEQKLVCRVFEDRTNADVFWVSFSNCVRLANETSFENWTDGSKQSSDIQLESDHQYDDKFVLYGYQTAHTFFYAWMDHGEYFYVVNLESRTLTGQTVDDLFTDNVDDFIYDVLNINANRE